MRKNAFRKLTRRFCAAVQRGRAEIPFPLYVFCFLLTAFPVVLTALLLLSRAVWYPGTVFCPLPFPLFLTEEIFSAGLLASVMSVFLSPSFGGGRAARRLLPVGFLLILSGILRLLLLLCGAGIRMTVFGGCSSVLLCFLLLFGMLRRYGYILPALTAYTVLRCLWLLSLLFTL